MPFRRRVPDPPSGFTGPLARYLGELATAINNIPVISYFSGTTPNSEVTGYAGDLAINVGSASTNTRAWILGGTPSAITNQGWVRLNIS